MKVAIIGGHMSPALAVIQQLTVASSTKKVEIMYIGRKHPMEGDSALSLEYQTMTNLGIRFIDFRTGRLQRKFTKYTIHSLIKLPSGFLSAMALLRREKPDVVVGFGGYVSVPLCIAAKMSNIPVVIHEQTTEAGLANKMIASFATKICLSWDSSKTFFPKEKTIVTGNPLVMHALTTDIKKYRKQDEAFPLITIVGGSQGSHGINLLIEGILSHLIEKYQVIHQTGDATLFNDYDRLVHLRDLLPKSSQARYLPVKFIAPGDIEKVFEDSDLVISRAGMNTVMQLLLLNKPSLLIPLPTSQNNEQLKNAQMVKKAGLAEVYEQDTLTNNTFFGTITHMIEKKHSYTNHSLSQMQELHLHAAEKVSNIILEQGDTPQ